MDLTQTVTKYVGTYEVRTGVRIPVPTNHNQIAFTLTAVCDNVTPERWHGEVSFAGNTLITTPTVDSHEKAGHDAEQALTAKVVELFSS